MSVGSANGNRILFFGDDPRLQEQMGLTEPEASRVPPNRTLYLMSADVAWILARTEIDDSLSSDNLLGSRTLIEAT